MINIDMVLEDGREKTKAAINDYLFAFKKAKRIDVFTYCELHDLIMPLLDKCYDLIEERKIESGDNNDRIC